MRPVFPFLREALNFSFQALQANKIRTALTALGLLIGNASVILVVTISITSRDLILDKIRGVGSNMIYAQYDGGPLDATKYDADFIKLADVDAVLTDITMPGMDGIQLCERIAANRLLLAGRFVDPSDVTLRQKVVLLDDKLAATLFGSAQASVGQIIKLHGLQFTVVGVFKERTSTFGLSELGESGAVMIPISVHRTFDQIERVDPMYVQVRLAADVAAATQAVAQVIGSRHRPGARYSVQNLGALLDAAGAIATVLTVVLILVSAIALVISGIGIMNIMLVTVTERTREIGLRMSLGASQRDVLLQFLLEAVLLSVGGGVLGIVAGLALPVAANLLQDQVQIPISMLSVAVAFLVSFGVGIVFGILPARRAARLNPTEALRYE